MLVASYECLRTMPPFRGWHLPESDDIEFRISRHRDREGHYTRYCRTDDHIISISSATIRTAPALLEVMAHEVIHLRQALIGAESKTKYQHNAHVWQTARRVCAIHGWDLAAFVGTPEL